MSKCIITGCALQTPDGGHIWGDLFIEGNCYVFNGCGQVNYEDTFEDEKKLIINDPTEQYFERRRVFVIHKDGATLNPKADAYLKKGGYQLGGSYD
jgi:hypothetical protein